MRVLVVGAAGFVGQYLIRYLHEHGDEVFGTSLDGRVEGLPPGRGVKLEITDPHECGDVIQRVKPEVVYHLAGIAFVPEAEADLSRTLQVNVAGTANVVRHCHLLNQGVAVLFVSSAEVYGQVPPHALPIGEETELRPANNYSLSKRMAELVVERYGRMGALRCTIARPFNHIGPGQDNRFVASNFAYQLASIALKRSPPILEVGNLEARRDFSDVRDIVKAYRRIAESGVGIYNLGSGVPRSIQSVLDTLIQVSGLQVEVRQDPARMRGPEVLELYSSNQKAWRECGWKPSISFEQSLEDVYRYWYDKLSRE
jgi:GDP-4-dehydro-6-deoxy-D-mannose reductase